MVALDVLSLFGLALLLFLVALVIIAAGIVCFLSLVGAYVGIVDLIRSFRHEKAL